MDPALLTFQEFWKLVNGQDKYHPSDAYDWPMAKMDGKREEYPTLLFRKKIAGISFEFRMKKEDLYQDKQYVKMDENHWPVRDPSGEIQYLTREDLERLKYRRYDYAFGVFDSEQEVGVAQDEWGCVLVAVAQEYRQFGLGPILTKLAWDAEPGKTTGGCTPKGAKAVQKVHQEYVREYMRSGTYSRMVREGTITKERVQEILKSAKLQERYVSPASRLDLNTNNPEDFLLFEQNGGFILYNRKLKDFLVDERLSEDKYSTWIDKCIKGHSFAGGGYHHDDKLYLHQLGGDTPQIKKFMFNLALSYAKVEGVPLKIFDDDLNMVNPAEVEMTEDNLATLKGQPINWQPFKMQEARFRKSFDKYNEFEYRLMELADMKFRDFGGGASASRRILVHRKATGSCLAFPYRNRKYREESGEIWLVPGYN